MACCGGSCSTATMHVCLVLAGGAALRMHLKNKAACPIAPCTTLPTPCRHNRPAGGQRPLQPADRRLRLHHNRHERQRAGEGKQSGSLLREGARHGHRADGVHQRCPCALLAQAIAAFGPPCHFFYLQTGQVGCAPRTDSNFLLPIRHVCGTLRTAFGYGCQAGHGLHSVFHWLRCLSGCWLTKLPLRRCCSLCYVQNQATCIASFQVRAALVFFLTSMALLLHFLHVQQ